MIIKCFAYFQDWWLFCDNFAGYRCTFWCITLDSATNSKKHNTFFFIGNQKTIINEKKKRQVQVVHDDEQQETNKTNNKTIEREIRKII